MRFVARTSSSQLLLDTYRELEVRTTISIAQVFRTAGLIGRFKRIGSLFY